jgi:hypothetical protein
MVLTYGFKGQMVWDGVVVVVVGALKQHFVLAVKVQKLSTCDAARIASLAPAPTLDLKWFASEGALVWRLRFEMVCERGHLSLADESFKRKKR